MIHTDDHNPILGIEWKRCAVCYAARSATFADVERLIGGPHDWNEMIARMQEIANYHVARLSVVRGPAA